MSKIRPFEWATIVYLVILSLVVFIYRETLPGWGYFIIAHITGIVGVAMMAYLPVVERPGWLGKLAQTIKDWYILPVILMLYEELGKLNRMVHGGFFDETVIRWEEALFGSIPALWVADTIDSPFLMELFNVGYFSYYLIFPVLGISLYLRDRLAYQHFTFAVAAAFLG